MYATSWLVLLSSPLLLVTLVRASNSSASEASDSSDITGYIVEPIMFTTSLVGNSLTIVVMRSPKFQGTTASRILTVLAISDMTISFLHPFNRPITIKLAKLDIRSYSEIGCKVFFWFWKTAKMTSSWFVVMITTERFIAVWMPLRVKLICTKRNTLLGIFAIYMGIGSFNAVWSFTSGLKNGKCVPDKKDPSNAEATRAFLLTGSCLYSAIPTVIMVILTPSICFKLFVALRKRKTLSTGDKESENDKQTLRTSVMLIGVTLAYMILVNPHAILHNISFANGKDFFEDDSIKTLREMAQILEQINYSINFFLYVMCSSQFRDYLLGLCRSRLKPTSHASTTRMSHLSSETN